MNIDKTNKLLAKILCKNIQNTALSKANNAKLEKLIKLKREEIDLLKLQKEMFNINELCAYTGMGKNYIYKLTSQGVLPHYKPNGKLLFFKKSEIDDFMQRNQCNSIDLLEEMLFKNSVKKIFPN